MTDDQRAELLRFVSSLMDFDGTDDELDETARELQAKVLHPGVLDLIFWHGKDREPTAEEIVDEALAYRPIEL